MKHWSVLFLFLITDIGYSKTVCDEKRPDRRRFPMTRKFKDVACYFILTNSTFSVNRLVDLAQETDVYTERKLVRFNVTAARLLCHAHNATLPIIKNEEEYKFFNNSNMVYARYYLLGMEKREDGTYQWDDGTPVIYHPVWHRWTYNNSPTVMLMDMSKFPFADPCWTESLALRKFDGDEPIPALCRQAYGTSHGTSHDAVLTLDDPKAIKGQFRATTSSCGHREMQWASAKMLSFFFQILQVLVLRNALN